MELKRYSERKNFFLRSQPWCADRLEIDDSKVVLSGWAVPCDGIWESVEFFVNDQPVEFSYKLDRSDLLQVFPFWEGSGQIGFRISIETKDLHGAGETIVVSRHRDSSISKYGNYYFPLSGDSYKNLPPARLRSQVHGSDDASSFVLEGFSSYKKIDFLFKEHLGDDHHKGLPVLDWGCGCARVCRYMLKENEGLHGVDVNGEAIDWCLANLSPRFEVSQHKPPLPYPDDYFQAVYGVSILTHLSLEDQGDWIAELLRVTRKNGIVLLSYHGSNSLLRFNLSGEDFEELQQHGYLNLGKNHAFGKDSEVGAKYFDTVQLPSSFQRIVGGWSVDLSFHEGVFGNHQDIIVLTKK